MAVIAMWKCDRDGSMFASKKDAEAYDRMLELAEGFAAVIEANFERISEEDAEAIGVLLAKHKDAVVAACKGNADALAAIGTDDADMQSEPEDSVVTPISAKA